MVSTWLREALSWQWIAFADIPAFKDNDFDPDRGKYSVEKVICKEVWVALVLLTNRDSLSVFSGGFCSIVKGQNLFITENKPALLYYLSIWPSISLPQSNPGQKWEKVSKHPEGILPPNEFLLTLSDSTIWSLITCSLLAQLWPMLLSLLILQIYRSDYL